MTVPGGSLELLRWEPKGNIEYSKDLWKFEGGRKVSITGL